MRNVALLVLDTVRRDFFELYASRLGEMVDVTYGDCRAASSWSVPSHASMFTGELPSEHGVHAYDRDCGSLSPADTFLGDLDDHRRIGVSANVFASGAFGFDRPFDEFTDVSTSRRFPDGMDVAAYLADVDDVGPRTYGRFLEAALTHGHPLQTVANGAATYFDALTADAPVPKLLDDGATAVLRECRTRVEGGDEPFFLFANLMDAHTPLGHTRGYDRSLHDAPLGFTTDEATVWEVMGATDERPDYARYRRGLYGAAVDYLDRQVAGFVEWLERRTDRPTTVVITSDHGENLGYPAESGMVRHKSSLSEGLLHVPLAVVNPPDGLAAADPSANGAGSPSGDGRASADPSARGEGSTSTGLPPRNDALVSHLDLGDLLVALAKEDCEGLDLGRRRAHAEVAGMSAGPEPPSDRDYWDRTIRAAYERTPADDGDVATTDKYVWDSLGNRELYTTDDRRPSWQSLFDAAANPPAWATDRFPEEIEAFAERCRGEEETATTTEAVERRLADLGYA